MRCMRSEDSIGGICRAQMLRSKPHLGFSLYACITGLILILSRFLFNAETYENPFLYWLNVLIDGLPMLLACFIFLAIGYWFIAFFKKETHPAINVLQLIFIFLSYFSICYVAGSLWSQTSSIPKFSILDYLIILSPYLSLVLFVINIIYSLMAPARSI